MHNPPLTLTRRSFLGMQALVAAAALSACARHDEGGSDTTQPLRNFDDIKEAGTLNIGLCSDNEPFGYINANGVYSGFDQYCCQYLSMKIGVDAHFVAVDPKTRYDKLLAHEVDICVAQMSPQDERAGEVAFSTRIYTEQLGLVSPAAALVESQEQLTRGELIVCEGSFAQQYAEGAWPEVKLRAYSTMTDAFGALRGGKGIALLTDEVTASCWAMKQADFVLSMRGIGEPREIAAAFDPGAEDLLEKCNGILSNYLSYGMSNVAYDTYVRPVVDADYTASLVFRA